MIMTCSADFVFDVKAETMFHDKHRCYNTRICRLGSFQQFYKFTESFGSLSVECILYTQHS